MATVQSTPPPSHPPCRHCGARKAQQRKRKLCHACYRQPHIRAAYPRRDRGISREAYFWTQVAKGDGCWTWLGAVNANGYGVFRAGTRMYAHRFGYELTNGPIPDGLCVLHRCDNPLCVRPDHLFLGTRTDNSADMVAKNRQAKGHAIPNAKITPDDVRAIRASAGVGVVELARRYGVSSSVVSCIIARKTWRHVDG